VATGGGVAVTKGGTVADGIAVHVGVSVGAGVAVTSGTMIVTAGDTTIASGEGEQPARTTKTSKPHKRRTTRLLWV
jgi:hypothetical protein